MENTYYGIPQPVFHDSEDCTSLRPHPRALKSEQARSKRVKNFMTKQRLQLLKRHYYNTR